MRTRHGASVLSSCIVLFLIGIAGRSDLAAQTQITTGVIQGTVLDASGATVPGVTFA